MYIIQAIINSIASTTVLDLLISYTDNQNIQLKLYKHIQTKNLV